MKFNWSVRVYWEDTDAGGIVFYANYLKFFERARTEWLRSLGIEQQKLRETHGMFVVSACELKYHNAARLDDMLLIETEIERLGQASIVLRQKAWREAPKQQNTEEKVASKPSILCEAVVRIGWVEEYVTSGVVDIRPQRMPSHIYNQILEYQA